jgi:acyl-CoA thioester hydrolase
MHSSTFDVHIFDLDPFGELRTNVLLRFLWQAASDASAAAGFDLDWYERAGTLWIIRRTGLEIDAPSGYRDRLRVDTQVIDFRRVRSQRTYTVRRLDDETIVARATTDWVYVDLGRAALAQPPAAMQHAFMPSGVSSRGRAASLITAEPNQAWCGSRRIELADLDTVAHVNNAQYAVFVEQAVWDALATAAWLVDVTASAAHLRATGHDLEYFDAAQYGDEVRASVWVSALWNDGFTSDCHLEGPRGRCLYARSTWRWSDGRLPPALHTAARSLCATS